MAVTDGPTRYGRDEQATKNDLKFLANLKRASRDVLLQVREKNADNKAFPDWKRVALERAIRAREFE